MLRRLAPLALALSIAAGCATRETANDPAAIAMAYSAAGRHAEAAREIELALRSHPEDAALRQSAARMLADAGDLEGAVEQAEVAIRLAPADPETWIALGELERRRGRPQEAYVAFRRAIERAPDDVRAVSGLALTADQLGFDEEADRAYAHWADLEQQQR